jgi:tetratricopeptide (TPR) repeat protein
MLILIQSKVARGVLWATTVVLVSVGGYFAGWAAETKYEDLITIDTPPPEVKLEEQGRYEEAIQAVLDRRREGLHEADADSRVAQIYLDRAKKDLANREKWAQQAASYLDKAAALAPKDPFILEGAMDGFNSVGNYSEQGCPDYEKAVGFGEAALALLQGSTVTVEGHVRSYPTQPIKEGIEPRLKRIRRKVEAWCRKTSQGVTQSPARRKLNSCVLG